MLASDILARAVTLLNDDDHTRWPLPTLADWLNEAIRAIVLAKPSASASTIILPLVAGTLQTLPAAGMPKPLMLIAVNRNIKTAIPAVTYGRVITPISRALLDAELPHWHDATYTTPRTEVKHYVYDEAQPLSFSVYPPNTGAGIVELAMSTLPVEIDKTGITLAEYETETVGLPEPYSVPLLDYVMYRAFLVDDLAGQGSKGFGHFQQFSAAIGLKIQVEGATSPNTRRVAT